MTGLEAVTAVAVYINSNKADIFSPKSGVVCKYEKTKEAEAVDEYIAVNNLPFVHRNASNTDRVNVNVHVKTTARGEVDTGRLNTIANRVISLFDYTDGVCLNGAYFRHLSESRPAPDDDGTYYVNIELECIHFYEKKITQNR